MRRILVPIDDSECCSRALDYAARQFGGLADLEIGLVHVLPGVPALFWDDGHILAGEEERDRSRWVGGWIARQRERMAPVLRAAADRLVQLGFSAAQVSTKFLEGDGDVAATLLEEAASGGYQTILLGRCGVADGRHFLVGSVTSRLIHRGAGIAVCIVE
jgi:nucleotide-binding universal stress UspA family protein